MPSGKDMGDWNKLAFVARANTTTFNTSVSMLQMDEYHELAADVDDNNNYTNNNTNNNFAASLAVAAASAGGFGSMMSPATFGGNRGGQFPNMTRVPTAAIIDDDHHIDGVGSGGVGGAGGGGAGAGNASGGFRALTAYGLENLALMTPAAVGKGFARQYNRQNPNQQVNLPSAFRRVASANSGGSPAGLPGNNNTDHGNSNGNTNSIASNNSMTQTVASNNSKGTKVKQRKFIIVDGARQAVEDALFGLKDDIQSTPQRMSSQAMHHLQHDETVLAFGCTNTLTSFFRAAAESIRFKVLLIDTANGNGGAGGSSLEAVNSMSVERVSMSSCYALMPRVSKVFLSTEAVFANGGLVAFAGSHAVCLAAKVCNVPVIVVVASLKFSDSFPSDSAGTTLIKVDQNQSRSVEWRDFLPPADILPPEFGSASDGFDCLYDTDSSDEDDDDGDDDDEGEGTADTLSSSTSSSSDDDNSSDDGEGDDEPLEVSSNINDNKKNVSTQKRNQQPQLDATAFSDTALTNSIAHQVQHQLNNNNFLSPRSVRQARKCVYKRHRPPVQVWNPLNEYVPPDCISIFVTELHEITPALVQVFVESLNEPKLSQDE